jgi:RNA-directed DNA polymerase
LRPILSERDLASRLGFPLEDLHRVADDVHAHYRQFPVVKGIKVRIVRPPLAELKLIQKRIKRKILDRIPLNDAAHGGVKGRAPASNAEQHLGQRCVINLDVRQFFDEVHHKMVYRLFCKELGFGRDVARLITRLTTLRDVLPQGAPTSTAMANLFLATPVDRPISNESSRIGIRYTRFVDDMTLSGPNPRPLINVVGKLLSRRGLPMHRKKARFRVQSKLKITSLQNRQEVTGLVVNSSLGLSVPRGYRDNLRAAICALRTSASAGLPRTLRSINGKIEYVRQFNAGSARRLQDYLTATLADLARRS